MGTFLDFTLDLVFDFTLDFVHVTPLQYEPSASWYQSLQVFSHPLIRPQGCLANSTRQDVLSLLQVIFHGRGERVTDGLGLSASFHAYSVTPSAAE